MSEEENPITTAIKSCIAKLNEFMELSKGEANEFTSEPLPEDVVSLIEKEIEFMYTTGTAEEVLRCWGQNSGVQCSVNMLDFISKIEDGDPLREPFMSLLSMYPGAYSNKTLREELNSNDFAALKKVLSYLEQYLTKNSPSEVKMCCETLSSIVVKESQEVFKDLGGPVTMLDAINQCNITIALPF